MDDIVIHSEHFYSSRDRAGVHNCVYVDIDKTITKAVVSEQWSASGNDPILILSNRRKRYSVSYSSSSLYEPSLEAGGRKAIELDSA